MKYYYFRVTDIDSPFKGHTLASQATNSKEEALQKAYDSAKEFITGLEKSNLLLVRTTVIGG